MSKIYLVSCDYLKENTTINNNVDNNLLNNSIWEAQSMHIQQITGTELYNKIIGLVENNQIGLAVNVKYKSLLDNYIRPAIVYWAWYESITYIAFKVVNKGIELQNSDYSNNTSIDQMEYLRDEIRNKAEFYSQRLTDFMYQNRSDYPELLGNHHIDQLHPTSNQYFSGIQFDSCGECGCIRTMGYDWRTHTLK